MLLFRAKNLKELVKIWNNKFPVDKWYRDKHKIPFNSEQHKNLSFIDMYFEYYEYIIYDYLPRMKKIKDEKKKNDDTTGIVPKYEKGKGNFMKPIFLTEEDIDKAFEELDIDSMD